MSFDRDDSDLRTAAEALLGFASTDGEEGPAQRYLLDALTTWGFETNDWEADPERLAEHRSFPDDPDRIDAAGRPNVAGILEVGDPDAGPTVVLNSHMDVVPATASAWTGAPFEPRWDGDHLVARGASDMKVALVASAFAALDVAALAEAGAADLNGRLVVESVIGEEAGGIGTASSVLEDPYPFERDVAFLGEPTSLAPVIACEGCLMKRLHVEGRAAHAGTPWRGEDVLPRFEAIRRAMVDLEAERHEDLTHPLYEDFPNRWPVVWGTVEAGNWLATVPDTLDATVRIGVAPGETVAEAEAVFDERLAEVVAADPWLADHPPSFERFSVQFESSEIAPDEPAVEAVGAALDRHGRDPTPEGATYGTDARYFVEAGIPAVVFGPGDIEQAHFPDESIDWADVVTYREVLADTLTVLLGGSQ